MEDNAALKALETWWCDQVKRARDDERAAVVALLREEERLHETHGSRFVASSLRHLGDIIEHGVHRREEEG